MSYIGGPLPGQERDEEYPQDIGKETFQKGVKSISDTYQKLPEPVKKNVSEASRFGGEIFSGLAEMNREARKSNILGLGPLDPFIGATKLYDKAIEGISDITGIYRGYFDLADFFIPATPTALKFSKRLSTTKKAAKLTNVAELNRLTNLGEAITRKTGIKNVARDSGVVQFLGSTDLDGIFSGRTNQLITDYKAKYPNREIYARTTIDEAVDIRKGLKAKGEKVPYFLDLTDNRLKFVVKKGTDYYGPGKHRYAFDDLSNKLANEANKRAIKLSKTIPIEDYIKELGPVEGTKAFNFNKKKMAKLYRWVSEEGAHLDHIWPLVSTKTEGFHHINNLILLYSKHNLKKSNKILPKALFEELGIPLTKRDLIRSTLQKPAKTNKVKRQRIIETLQELGILEMK